MRALLAVLLLLVAGCVDVPGDPGGAPGDAAARAFVADCALSNWADPCTALASPNPSPSKAEVDIAVNPRDPLNIFVASKDLDPAASDCVWSVGQVTKDGGRTWKTVYVGGTREPGVREPSLLPFACVTDPILAWDQDGVLYYALQAYRLVLGPDAIPELPRLGRQIVGSTFILARSVDGGETFDRFVPQHAADGVAIFHDYPRMLVNPASGSVCAIWNGVGDAGVTPWVSCTRDGGETVDPPVTFFSEDAPRMTDFQSGFAALRDGSVYVTVSVNAEVEDAERDIRLFASSDDARSFQEVGPAFRFLPAPRQLETNEFRSPSFVEMAADATGGPFADRLYVFYPDFSTGDSDILSRYSMDRGATWSEPVPIHANRTNDQIIMRPAVAPDGTVHVLFYDRQWDPENRLLDAAHAWSTDGGVTWQGRRLTASSFDGDLGIHQNGPPFIGDYNGIAVDRDGVVHMAWGDTRTGAAEIAYARVSPLR